MLKGMASAFLVLLLFGVALGAALFRPADPSPVLDALTVPEAGNPAEGEQDPVENTNPSPADIESMLREIEQERSRLEEERLALQEERARLEQEQAELDEREAEPGQRQAELDKREAGLNQRQVELDEREAELDQRQAELDEREAELEQRQVELDEREAKLEDRAASLQVWEERLIKQDSLLDEDWVRLREAEARLRTKEANLAELEQKLQGLLRWSVVATVVSGLMAVPSVLVLIALMRQDQRTPDKGVERTQASQIHQRERVTQRSVLATVAPTPIHGNDGRNKENGGHCL